MDLTIFPSKLSGQIAAPSSKSMAHRLLICAALADAPTELFLSSSLSDDIAATIGCLRTLGAGIEAREDSLLVTPIGCKGQAFPLLDCHESGSTLRFLLPVACALREKTSFTGQGRLPQRPLKELMDVMQAHGVSFSAKALPFSTNGVLRGGDFSLPGDISSQYVSGLFLAFPLLAGKNTLSLTSALQSKGYIDLTLSALQQFGVLIEEKNHIYISASPQKFHSPGKIAVEGDWSNAAFFLVAGALGHQVTVNALQSDSKQGDGAILPLLRQFGAAIEQDRNGFSVTPAPLQAATVDLSDIPDLLPILAVLATKAAGETRFLNGARLRLKESDRLASTCAMIHSLGGRAEEHPDGLSVWGGGLSGGTVESFGDHRIVMAAAIAATACTGAVTIRGADAVAKSYPAFFQDFQELGGVLHVI